MVSFEALKVVENRILKLESQEFAHAVLGYLCIHYQNDEIIRLALGPDISIHNLISEAKVTLQLSSSPVVCPPVLPSVNLTSIPDPSLQYACFQPGSPQGRCLPPRLPGAGHWEYEKTELMGLKDQFEPFDSVASGSKSYFCNEGGVNNISLRHNQDIRSAPEVTVKHCYYFNKGLCKDGSKCLYFHGQLPPDNYSHMFGPNSPEFGYEDQVFTPRSLKILEMEITELLKCRGGGPISIASLPYLYFETYKKQLLAGGYPAETERHGKSGIELMKLLALSNTAIRLVQRPDGEIFIMLAEDAAKNLKVRAERNNPDPVVSDSRQVYIIFKSDSTFTEEDVSNYFGAFGPVQEVIFPLQRKRIFGTNHEKLDSLSYSLQHMDINSERQSRFHTQQLMEEHNRGLDVKFGGQSNLNMSRRPHGNQSYFDRSIQESGVSQDPNRFTSTEQFHDGHLTETSRTDPDSEGYHLPPNLFE